MATYKIFRSRVRFAAAVAGLLAIFAAVECRAATLEDYQKRLNSAQQGVAILLDNIASEEAGEPVTQPDSDVYDKLRGLLPPSEEIATSTGAINTQNQWFTTDLKRAESETDRTKRAIILTAVRDRLYALAERLDSVIGPASSSVSKDEEKRKLGEILSRPEYQPPEPQTESKAGELLRRFFEWLESLFPSWAPKGLPLTRLGGLGRVAQYALVALLIGVIVFVLYRLRGLFFRGRKARKANEPKDRVVLGEVIGEGVTAEDLFGEADALAKKGDLRGAIRKSYIALLFEMSERKFLSLARHKTNRDYLRDLRGKAETHSAMNELTGAFERHWYGARSAADEDWARFRSGCGNAMRSIS